MTLIEADNIYYNTQVYFRKHFIDDLPNDHRVWEKVYSEWLQSQGCEIVYSRDILSPHVLRNSLGIAPYYDKFGFKNPEDATMFILRWA